MQLSFVVSNMLRVLTHVNTVYTSVSYIIQDDTDKCCWIIDVGDYDDIRDSISGYQLKGVLLTHVHYDHIYGLNALLADHPMVPVYTNLNGRDSLYSPSDNLSAYHDENFVLATDNVIVVSEGDSIRMADETLEVYETPGHDYSCLTFRLGDYLFTGDAYIPGVKVYTKLQNGNKEDAERSLMRITDMLSDGVMVMPGHIV